MQQKNRPQAVNSRIINFEYQIFGAKNHDFQVFVQQLIQNQGNFDKTVTIFLKTNPHTNENPISELRQEINNRCNLLYYLKKLQKIQNKQVDLFRMQTQKNLKGINKKIERMKIQGNGIKMILLKMSVQEQIIQKQEEQKLVLFVHDFITSKNFNLKLTLNLIQIIDTIQKYNRVKKEEQQKKIISLQDSQNMENHQLTQKKQKDFKTENLIETTFKRTKIFEADNSEVKNKKAKYDQNQQNNHNPQSKSFNLISLQQSIDNMDYVQNKKQDTNDLLEQFTQKMMKISSEFQKSVKELKTKLNLQKKK